MALSSVVSTDWSPWALRPSTSGLWRQHRLTCAPCSVSEGTLAGRWTHRAAAATAKFAVTVVFPTPVVFVVAREPESHVQRGIAVNDQADTYGDLRCRPCPVSVDLASASSVLRASICAYASSRNRRGQRPVLARPGGAGTGGSLDALCTREVVNAPSRSDSSVRLSIEEVPR